MNPRTGPFFSIFPLALWAFLLPSPSWCAPAGPPEIYVSPSGRDGGPGTREHPLASFQGALAKLQALENRAGAVVWIQPGTYRFRRTLWMSTHCGGKPGAPVTWKALPGGEVRITGGISVPASAFRPLGKDPLLSRFPKKARNRILRADLAALGVEDLGALALRGMHHPILPAPAEVFFDGRPLDLARWPNQGFSRVLDVLDAGGGKKRRPARLLLDPARTKAWGKAGRIWLHGYWHWDWADEQLPVKLLDPDRGLAAAPVLPHYPFKKGARFFARDLPEELDRPGEYWIDRKAKKLYLIPPRPMKGAKVTLSLLEIPLLVMKWTYHVRFQGLTFACARGDGAFLHAARDVVFTSCTFENLGNRAVVIDKDCRKCGLVGCSIHDTGEGGLVLAGGDRKTLAPGNNFVEGCDIHHFARLGRTYKPGVNMTGVGQRVVSCRIHDAPHAGILFFSCNDCLIEKNEFFHLCFECDDAGAVYTGRDWTLWGNKIRFNLFHHITGLHRYGAQGVYLDDAASGIEVRGNVFHRVQRAMLLGGGRDLLVEDNLISHCPRSIHLDARALGWMKKAAAPGGILRRRLAAMPYKKEPWRSRFPALRTYLRDDPGAPKHNRVRNNLIFASGKPDIAATARKTGKIGPNLVLPKNPGFRDPEHLDFRLTPEGRAFLEKSLPRFRLPPLCLPGKKRKEETGKAGLPRPRFLPLKVGEVKPGGWIRDWILRDLHQGTTGNYDKLDPTVTHDRFGAGKVAARGGADWWNGEHEGYWKDALTRAAGLTGDRPFLERVRAWMERILRFQGKDGYIGIYTPETRYPRKGENGELWTQRNIFLAMLAWYEITGDQRFLHAVERAVAADMAHYGPGRSYFNPPKGYRIGGGATHGLAFVEILDRLFELTGDRRYARFARFLYEDYSRNRTAPNRDCALFALLDPGRRFRGHGVHVAEQFRVPLLVYFLTGEKKYKEAFEAALRKLAYHLTPSGALVSDEAVRGRKGSPDLPYEYCTITELTAGYLLCLRKTGRAEFGDRVERLVFNAAPGARLPDLRALSYLTTDNRLSTPLKKKRGRFAYRAVHLAAACCTLNAGRLMPHLASGMWARDGAGGGLAALVYGPCRVETTVKGARVTLEEETSYPFEEKITFRIAPEKEVEFPLTLRIPGWCGNPRVLAPGTRRERTKGYITLLKKWKKGDTVTLVLPAEILSHRASNGQDYLSRGPLLYALPLPVEKKIVRKFPLKGFYVYDMVCLDPSGWKYTFAGGPKDFTLLKVLEKTSNPWADPPLALAGPMKDPAGKTHDVRLVPFGATILRRLSF